VNTVVARFIGSPSMNLREVPIAGDEADLGGYRIPLPREARAAGNGTIIVGFRPDAVDIVDDGTGGLDITTEVVEELGSDAYLFGSLPGRDSVTDLGDVVARIDPRRVPAKGQSVRLRIRPDEIHLFSPASGERLN
jgi:multiple sugar transport system ATP-binding protein